MMKNKHLSFISIACIILLLLLINSTSSLKLHTTAILTESSTNDEVLVEVIKPSNHYFSIDEYIISLIEGTSGSDTLIGTASADEIRGYAGNDFIRAGYGNDEIYGGVDNDLIYGEAGNDVLYGDEGNDDLRGGIGEDVLFGGIGNDVLRTGSGYSEALRGGEGNDLLISNHFGNTTGDNSLLGGTGNDIYLFETNSQFANIGDEGGTADAIAFTSEIALEDLVINRPMGQSGLEIFLPTNDIGTNHIIRIANQSSGSSTYEDDILERLIINTASGAVYYTMDFDHVIGDDNDNIIYAARGAYHQHGGLGNDQVFGNEDRNFLYGDKGSDRLFGLDDNDQLFGGFGGDFLYGGNGVDALYGGEDGDQLRGEAGRDGLYGEEGNDALFDNYDNYFDGGDGNDTVNLATSVAGVRVDFSASLITDLDSFRDGFVFNVENVAATYFDDEIYTDDNNNSVFSYTGNDIIQTKGGNDIIYTTADAEVDGGSGANAIGYIYETTAGININLITGVVSNTSGQTGTVLNITNVLATHQNDVIITNEDNNTIRGLNGDDEIRSGAGNDLVFGDDGNDTLYGDDGIDMLYGGAGADRFVFESTTAFIGTNRIKDFSLAENDMIDISEMLSGYNPATHSITDFVNITEGSSYSTLEVDSSGTGNFQQVVIIVNVTGITNIQQLVDDGHLVL